MIHISLACSITGQWCVVVETTAYIPYVVEGVEFQNNPNQMTIII